MEKRFWFFHWHLLDFTKYANKKEKRKKEPGAQKKARRAGVDEEVEVGSGTHPVQDLSPALQCYTLKHFKLNIFARIVYSAFFENESF